MLCFAVICAMVLFASAIGFVKTTEKTRKIFLNVSVVSAMFCFIFSIATYALSTRLVYFDSVSDKINIYTEANTKIEALIQNSVKQYMAVNVKENATENNSENTKSSENASTNYIAMIPFCPELKNDSFIQTELSKYVENEQKIVELKAEYAGRKVICWWLWFKN